jgi:NAD(P)-dependent dehydrogenase (short-subunit alcohol dehydrogenase family)
MSAFALPAVPSFRLDGRRALVTGASRGIGFASAAALAGQGAHVTLLARSRDEVEAAAAAIAAAGHEAEAVALDIADREALRGLVESRPAFDILVNNAGTSRPATLLDTSEEQYDTVMDLNVRAAYFAAQAVAARMVAQGVAGSIINMSSTMGHVGGPDRTVYCASKHALEGMTKAMAVELAVHGIRVNTLCPTFVETPMTASSLSDPERRSWILSKIKLGRLSTVDDLTGPVVFLASDAARFVTGTALIVDGGWTAG